MRVFIKCPRCGIAIALSIADADRRRHCVRCDQLFRVPDTEAMDKALALVRSAQCDVYVDSKGNVYA